MRLRLTQIEATNIVRHEGHVSRQERENRLKQRGVLLWLTGLPSSGKSTIAYTVEHALVNRGLLAYVLDGDNIRFGLNKNLGFSAEDRAENIRRILKTFRSFQPCRGVRPDVREAPWLAGAGARPRSCDE